jgi:hypothetical protein
VAAAAASSRPLFFLAALDVLDGDSFILQVQGVFTRIRSGATLKALGGGALESTTATASARSGFASDGYGMATARMGEKPEGFWLLFISQTGSATGGWISARAADSAAVRDPLYSTSRRASPRRLG